MTNGAWNAPIILEKRGSLKVESASLNYVYMLINPLNQMPFYVGITISPDQRFAEHLDSKEGKMRVRVVSHIKSRGLSPLMVILERKPNRKAARLAEIFWIELLASRGTPIVNKEILGGLDSVSFHTSDIREQAARKEINVSITPHQETKTPSTPSQKPKNHGNPWAEAEITLLQQSFLAGKNLDALALAHQRTRAGILGQLTKLAKRSSAIYSRMAELNLLPSQEAYRQFQNS